MNKTILITGARTGIFEMEQIGVKVKIVELEMIATDFGGRSFDFQAGEITDYQPINGRR